MADDRLAVRLVRPRVAWAGRRACVLGERGSMGTWGSGIFENDDAVDWLGELEESKDISAVTGALTVAAESDDTIEMPESCAALAAAEVVAAMAGQHADGLPDTVAKWLKEVRPRYDDTLLDLALEAVKRVRANSELRELWEESGDLRSWLAALSDLKRRLL